MTMFGFMARDYFETLRSVGFKVDEVDYTATLSDQEIDRYRLAKGEIIPVVYKATELEIIKFQHLKFLIFIFKNNISL